MKVTIGPYKKPLNGKKLVQWTKRIGVPQKNINNISTWLDDTFWFFFDPLFDSDTSQKIKVKIDDYDLWNADITLAHVIHPVLVKLKQQKHGVAYVDNEDVPENLRTEEDEPELAKLEQKWFYCLDEMIWTFDIIKKDEYLDEMSEKIKYERVANGLRLFAKYYFSLWD